MMEANLHVPFVATEAQQGALDDLDAVGAYLVRGEGEWRVYRQVGFCRHIATRKVQPICIKCGLVCNTLFQLLQHQPICMGIIAAMVALPFHS